MGDRGLNAGSTFARSRVGDDDDDFNLCYVDCDGYVDWSSRSSSGFPLVIKCSYSESAIFLSKIQNLVLQVVHLVLFSACLFSSISVQ